MFTQTLTPTFSDTDALGHINNTRIPVWFELGRNDVCRLFTPDLDPRHWVLILARMEIEYRAELFFNAPIEMRTGISRIGTSSFTVEQTLHQHGRLGAEGRTVMIHFDHAAKQARPIPDAIREAMEAHRIAAAEAAT
ncbi:acyl-CoA thioesterase [Modicisalibacter tunisiensis]|uniref:acyl-CoA thioesterase n=1 Tax=Modicisalibacter tunisiensis TaxID=390637 RepID=UPI001CC9D7E6|nr:thioesterase family protein [Modicisalibacter tunisiensis]MBZ9540098.1 acyl-CoA thioesterase [Modicisalibacter tunisiensis]